MAEDPIRHWHAMTTREAGELADRDPVVILPVAAIEQHGPHLPLSTDLDIGEGILAAAFRRLSPEFPAWALPPQSVGSSSEHLRFPGTLSLAPEQLGEIVFQLGEAVAATGVRRLVLHNSHGGNRPTLESAALRLRRECGLLVVKATYTRFPRPPGVDFPEEEWRHGFHGGAVETSMMLHLHPHRVRRESLGPFPSLGGEMTGRVGPEGEAPFAWLAGDLNPHGVVGDARLADPATGARLVEHYGVILAEVVEEARRFPLERLR